jgi:predicted nucleotidyltransferase
MGNTTFPYCRAVIAKRKEKHIVQTSNQKIFIFVNMSNKATILKKITELATIKFPDSEIYLYGSRARGDANKISDWDLLILLHSKNISFDLETSLMDEFYELELETGEIFSPLIYSKYDWSINHISTSLFQNIQKEGIRIK